MATRVKPPKKVRLACRRCRARRIKCDGQVPACTNCAKSGEVCLDVDSQNSGLLVPRNFASAARARIQWLEDIIKEQLPDVDLSAGPQIDGGIDANPSALGIEREADDGPSPPIGASRNDQQVRQSPQSLKRPAEGASVDSIDASFPERAHSIAVNLGMLSLNSDSASRHYLGSSSGLLFTHLVGASPSSTGSPSALGGEISETEVYESPEDEQEIEISRQHYRSLFNFLRQELPRKEDAVILVQTYLRWMHYEYPILEPASLLSALDALYSCSQFSLENERFPHGWPTGMSPFRWNGRLMDPQDPNAEIVPMPVIAFIMFMVFNIAAIVKVRSRVYEFPPERFYRQATHFSQDTFAQISLGSIQALVTLITHSILTPSNVHLWTLIHVALAHCIELGVHREEKGSSEEFAYQQVRRFTFFTIYSLDRSVSSIQGRPLGFRDETFDIKLPDPDVHSRFLENPMNVSFSSAVTKFATFQWELDRIVSDIKLLFYHLPGSTSRWFSQPFDPQSQQSRMRELLVGWWERASTEPFANSGLDNRQRRIWALKLKIKYQSTMVMLFQPSQMLRNPNEESLQICFDNAACILHDYQAMHDFHGLHNGWRSVQNIFAAGATLIYSFWTSAEVRRNASNTDLSKSLRTCSSLLTVGGEWWPSVKKGQESFGSLADLTIQRLYVESAPSKVPRLTRHQLARPRGPSTRGDMSMHSDGLIGLGTPVAPSGLENVEDSYGTHNSDLGLGSSDQETWQDPNFGIPTQEAEPNEVFPEIENFLAEFDRSDFIWSFSFNGFGDQYSLGNLPEFGG